MIAEATVRRDLKNAVMVAPRSVSKTYNSDLPLSYGTPNRNDRLF
jgi:hypothetical protein